MYNRPHWLTGEIMDESSAPWILGLNRSTFLLGAKSAGMFLLIFLLLTINLLAVSVAIQCNRGSNQQMFPILFAAFFGPIYLIMNYYFIRLLSKGQDCKFSTLYPFGKFFARSQPNPQPGQ